MITDEMIALLSAARAAHGAGDHKEALRLLEEVDKFDEPMAGREATNLRQDILREVDEAKRKEEAEIAREVEEEKLFEEDDDTREGDPSAGTSSSASGSKQDKSGSSAPETGSSRQSPAQSAENHSSQDQAAKPAQSSTARSTSGSTQGTGQDRPRQSGSSAELAAEAGPTQTPDTASSEVPSSGGFLISGM